MPAKVAGPIWYGDRLWAVTRFVPGKPLTAEPEEQRAERGAVLARLHEDLRDLDMGQRQRFFEACDLEGMGDFQDWDPGVLTGYQRASGHPLTDEDLAAIEPLQVVFRVNMVMAELWTGQRTGTFDEAMIDRQLTRAGS